MSEAKPYPKAMQLARGERRYRRKIASPKQWQAIIAAKGGTCRLLESVMTNLDLRGRRGQLGPVQYHHLVPRDLGGDDVADNIIPLCDLCHRGITDRLPGHVTALLHTLSDAEYAYAVGKAGEDVWERVYGIRYSR